MSGMILGLDELFEDLEELGNIDLYKPIAQATEFVRSAARGLAPVSPFGSAGELRDSIQTDVRREGTVVNGICFTNKEYAEYVEFGTGPAGSANHAGISPDVSPTYTPEAWWIHESQIDDIVAFTYHFYALHTDQGIFYRTDGQAAQPFMYPALNENKDVVADIIMDYVGDKL